MAEGMGSYRVELDLTDSHCGMRETLAYWHDMQRLEDQMIYAALNAGHYNIEGGYPCMLCAGRHRPLAVFYNHQLVWTVARS